jgi:hypothetical protein
MSYIPHTGIPASYDHLTSISAQMSGECEEEQPIGNEANRNGREAAPAIPRARTPRPTLTIRPPLTTRPPLAPITG